MQDVARRFAPPTRALARHIYRTSRDGVRLYQLAVYRALDQRTVRRSSVDELRAKQWRKLERLLAFAYQNVPFYRDRFRAAGIVPEDIRTAEDLARIPPLTKDDLRQNFPDRLVRSDRTYSPHQLGRSSGSTGESVHFVRPDAIWRRSLYYTLLGRFAGIWNLPVFVLTSPLCTPNSCSLEYDDPDNAFTNALLRIPGLRHLAGMISLPAWLPNMLTAPEHYMATICRRLMRHGPSVMIADPVYLGAVARYVRRTGEPVPPLRLIITSYELLTGSLRDLLSDVFRCPIYTQYGASEVTDIASECENERLHVRMDMVLLEGIRESRRAAPGDLARVLVTDLENFNMPLIRYDIGDLVRLGNGPCPCGRRTETITAIEGRLCDALRSPDGVLTPLAVDEIFRGLAGIAAYCVVQEARDCYRVSLMPDAGAPIDVETVRQRCRRLLGDGGLYHCEVVDEIAPRPSNKFRFVHSLLPPGEL